MEAPARRRSGGVVAAAFIFFAVGKPGSQGTPGEGGDELTRTLDVPVLPRLSRPVILSVLPPAAA